MICSIMLHLILVFTVCQSTILGVSVYIGLKSVWHKQHLQILVYQKVVKLEDIGTKDLNSRY